MAITFEEIARQSRLFANAGMPVGPCRSSRLLTAADLASGFQLGEDVTFLIVAETP